MPVATDRARTLVEARSESDYAAGNKEREWRVASGESRVPFRAHSLLGASLFA